MRKAIALCLSLLMLTTAGCTANPEADVTEDAPTVTDPTPLPTPSTELEQTLGNLQLLLVNGALYYNTKLQTTALYGSPDATIASSRYPGNVPNQENQSNFGTGYEYYFDGDNHLSVSIDGTWWRFERVIPMNPWGLELYVENVTASGADIVCNRYESEVTEEITVGTSVTLEQWTDDGWRAADGLMHIMDMDWGTQRRSIETGGTLRWSVDWTPFYGELEPGSYRLYKQFRYVSADGIEHYYNVYTRFEITADTPAAYTQNNRWGVEMTADNITPDGLTLTVTCSDASDWEVTTGEPYTLEVLSAGTWLPYERTDGLMIDYAWNAIGYLVSADTPMTEEIDWTWLHGTLPPGEYRLGKEFTASQPSDRDPPHEAFALYVEFEIRA